MTNLSALGPFLDPVAIGIVGGGTLLTAVLRSPSRDLWRAICALGILHRRDPFDAGPALVQIASLARIAKRHGVTTLDRSVISDPDIAAGVAAIVDGAKPEGVAAEMAHRRRARIERQTAAQEVWSGMAEAAPAMGMVGTLIGLIRMFMAMTDPTAIGGAMAIALLTTLYGALVANLIAAPIANRLKRLTRAEAFERARMEAPLAAIAKLGRPRATVEAEAA